MKWINKRRSYDDVCKRLIKVEKKLDEVIDNLKVIKIVLRLDNE